jgi:hypothetical protein
VGTSRTVPGRGRPPGLSPLAIEIALALGQEAAGLRLTELAAAIGAPVSSVQTALRSLIETGIVERTDRQPPGYRLVEDHPATADLVNLATRLTPPELSLAIVLRSCRSILYAGRDALGIVVAVDPAADREDRARLLATLDRLRSDPRLGGSIAVFEGDELARLVRVDLGLRARLVAAEPVRGRLSHLRLAEERARSSGPR